MGDCKKGCEVLDAFCCGVDIVVLCWESKGDSPFDAVGSGCGEVVNVRVEEDADGVGAGDIERLFDVGVDCGDNFLDRGSSFALRAWPMPLRVPDIITIVFDL